MCVCVSGVLPSVNGDSSSIPEERGGGSASPKTPDLSVWRGPDEPRPLGYKPRPLSLGHRRHLRWPERRVDLMTTERLVKHFGIVTIVSPPGPGSGPGSGSVQRFSWPAHAGENAAPAHREYWSREWRTAEVPAEWRPTENRTSGFFFWGSRTWPLNTRTVQVSSSSSQAGGGGGGLIPPAAPLWGWRSKVSIIVPSFLFSWSLRATSCLLMFTYLSVVVVVLADALRPQRDSSKSTVARRAQLLCVCVSMWAPDSGLCYQASSFPPFPVFVLSYASCQHAVRHYNVELFL